MQFKMKKIANDANSRCLVKTRNRHWMGYTVTLAVRSMIAVEIAVGLSAARDQIGDL